MPKYMFALVFQLKILYITPVQCVGINATCEWLRNILHQIKTILCYGKIEVKRWQS